MPASKGAPTRQTWCACAASRSSAGWAWRSSPASARILQRAARRSPARSRPSPRSTWASIAPHRWLTRCSSSTAPRARQSSTAWSRSTRSVSDGCGRISSKSRGRSRASDPRLGPSSRAGDRSGYLDLVAAHLLRSVKRLVSRLERLARIGMGEDVRNAGRKGDLPERLLGFAVEEPATGEVLARLIEAHLRLRRRHPAKQQDELLAAVARDVTIFVGAFREDLGDELEDPVAGVVPVQIVDPLE